jgi:hypothetical protein
MISQKKRRQRRRGRKGVPVPERGNAQVGRSVNIPPPSYLKLNVGGIEQSIRRTLVWAVAASTLYSSTYQELQVVLMNSPYDPDSALGGLSAAGFAKYMAFYTKCFTLGARIKIKFANGAGTAGGTSTASFVVGCTISTTITPFASQVAAIQGGLCDWKLLNLHPDSGELDVGVDIAKFVDKPNLLDDPQWFCTATANPAQLIVAHLWVQGNVPTMSNTIAYTMEMEMDCVFTDPTPFT